MARITEATLTERAFARGLPDTILDLSSGGQHGWSVNHPEWINNQAYVRRNLVCILLEAPRFFQLMPDPGKWVQMLRSLMELHSQTIEGLKSGLEVSVEDHPIGGGGEVQHEFTDVKREASSVTTTHVEKYGRPIQKLLDNWIRYGMMDPEAKFAMVATLGRDKIPTDLLADWYSMSCLFFEPDPTHQTIEKAWVGANMWPKGTNTVEGKKDKTAASELLNLSIEWTGFYDSTIGSKVFAQRILDSINQVNANPYLRPSFIQNLAPDVDAALKNYKKELENLGSSAIVPTSGNG